MFCFSDGSWQSGFGAYTTSRPVSLFLLWSLTGHMIFSSLGCQNSSLFNRTERTEEWVWSRAGRLILLWLLRTGRTSLQQASLQGSPLVIGPKRQWGGGKDPFGKTAQSMCHPDGFIIIIWKGTANLYPGKKCCSLIKIKKKLRIVIISWGRRGY